MECFIAWSAIWRRRMQALNRELNDRRFNYMVNFWYFSASLKMQLLSRAPHLQSIQFFPQFLFSKVTRPLTRTAQIGRRRKKGLLFVRPIHSDLSSFVVLIMCQSRITEVLNSAIMPAQKRRRIQEADHFGISKHDTIRGKKKSLIPTGIRGSD